jgi:hypothetical protein
MAKYRRPASMRKFIGTCPYKGCGLGCSSEYNHRAKYAYITKNWKAKVERMNSEVQQGGDSVVHWNTLKNIGILYSLPKCSPGEPT